MNLSALPNAISVLRIALVVPVAILIHLHEYGWALTLFVIAGVSDGLDGFLAKHFGWTSRLGTILDPVADKLLLLTTYFMLAWQGLIPAWLFALVLIRDVGIVSLSVYYLLSRHHSFEIRPQLSSKINTVAQIALVIVVMLEQWGLSLPAWTTPAMTWVVTATTTWSAVVYFRMWAGLVARSRRARSAG